MKLSACLIVKNDAARLERAVASIRPYVDEVVIVDTGSTDDTAATAARLADKFELFTACNFEDGEISDFSAARNRALDLCSHNTVIWLDADDIIVNGEQIAEAIGWCHEHSGGQPWRAKFAYDYDHDSDGRCIVRQPRERIVYPKAAFRWAYRVHEGLTALQPTEWRTLEPPQAVSWVHDMDRTRPRSKRNLRILRDHVQKIGAENVDPKTQLDLGCELAKSGDHLNAIAWLTRFYTESDLTDERVLACLQLVDVLSFWPGREQDAEIWGHRAADLRPEWGEGYWAIAKVCYAHAARDLPNERKHLARAVHFARKGLACAPTNASTASNPLERGGIQALIFDAATRLGHFEEALAAARACLAERPDDVTTKLHVAEAERRVARPMIRGLDVVIMCGVTIEAWDPATAASRGIGGSETAVIEMGRRLAAQGHRVRVFCRCFTAGVYDGVEYRPMNESEQASGCDLLIAWRNASLLEATPARVKWLWLHDTGAFGANAWNVGLADRILCLSQWHAEHVAESYPAQAHKISVTRNGIDLPRFEASPERHPHRAIYSSSPDRGLDQLLDMWPAIRWRVPDAELHVFYGFAAFGQEYRSKLEKRAAETQGVVLRDRVDQKQLALEMLSAGAWLYPSWSDGKPFTETSCISAMEAQAAGLRIVTSSYGALPETVRYGVQIPGDATFDAYQRHFVDAAVVALTQDASIWRPVSQEYARQHFGWDGVAEQWSSWMAADVGTAPRVAMVDNTDRRPTLHMILAPNASGAIPMDAAGDPGAEAMGGGSRVGFLGLVEAMAKRGGYRVRAFSTFQAPCVERHGAEYVRLDRMSLYAPPDVVLAYYDTSPLSMFGSGVLRIASHHTYSPYMHFESADVNTAPSQAALEYLRDRYDPTSEWWVLPNAVGEMPIERRPVSGRIIYHTSPDRGLHILLATYPLIKRAVPGASLHIVGGVQEWVHGRDQPGAAGVQQRAARDALKVAQAAGGVELLGRLTRATLWDELSEAACFAFPCAPIAPCETFSISLMECCKIGVPVVLAPADALESIYAGHVRMAPHDTEGLAEAVTDVLTSEAEQSRLVALGKDLAREYTFDRAATVLDRIIRQARPVLQGIQRYSRSDSDGDALAAYL